MAIAENNLSPPVSVLTEVSQMANLFESSQMNRYNQNSHKEQGFIDMLLRSGWYASRTRGFYSENSSVPSDIFEAVKVVLNNGKRTLPTGIVEHDSMSDIASITNDGAVVDKNNRANYIPKKTIIKNKMSSTYIFYRWSDHNAPDNKKGDPFGYFQNGGVGQFEDEANQAMGGLSLSSAAGSASSKSISSTGPSSDPDVVVTSDFKNYAGDEILTQAQRNEIAKNRPIYEAAAKEKSIPWQILAVLHYREHGLAVSNPNNGQGIYQLYSYTEGGTNNKAFLPAGAVSDDEFLRQSKIAAQVVKDKEPKITENPDSNTVKRLFFKYNGEADIYIDQALDMGFTTEQANNGEGSPYVMSRADAKRDSTKGGMTWTMYTSDNKQQAGRNEVNFGAYVVYLALGGFTDNSGTTTCTDSSSGYSGAGNSDITKTAIDLSWHHYDTDNLTKSYFAAALRSNPRKTGTSKYQEAIIQVNNNGDQSDCGRFVSTVLRISGVDSNFPPIGTAGMLPYLQKHSELYDEIPNNFDTSVLQSGDILVVNGHIKLVIEINGKMQEVQASLHGHAPETSDGVNLKRGQNGKYFIFRKNKSNKR